MKKFQIENILIYGESSRAATTKDIDLIAANPTNEYHLLRHYPLLPQSYTDTLIGEEYEYFDDRQQRYVRSIISPKDIEAAYRTPKTKFYPGIQGMKTPRELIRQIKNEFHKRISSQGISWIQKSDREVLIFTATYPQPVGDQALVLVGTQDQLRPTNLISVEMNLFPGKSFTYLTAYPGNLTPEFPNKNQSVEEYDYCKHFWETHTFAH